jgi:cytochrome c biogenesis protein CcdA
MEIPLELTQIWLPLVAAALVQASFGLSVSVLTLLSGHLMSEAKSRARLSRLSLGYIAGSALATLALLLAFVPLLGRHDIAADVLWWIVIAVALAVGLATMLFYYRREKVGTRLWLPRRAAEYLDERTRATTRSFEAFMLGVGSIVAELVFVIAPLLIAAHLVSDLDDLAGGLAALALYVAIAILPLLVLFMANTGGRKISGFQKWREKNKKFLQIMAGLILIVLAFYLIIYKITGE